MYKKLLEYFPFFLIADFKKIKFLLRVYKYIPDLNPFRL